MVDLVQRFGDVDGEHVPTPLVGVLGVEIVGTVLTGAAAALDDVLVVVADDDGEVAVLLHALFGDGLQRAHPAVAVRGDDGVDYRRREFARLSERRSPVVSLGHGRWFRRRRQNTFDGRDVRHPAATV